MSPDGSTVVLFRALPAALKLSSTEKRSLQEFAHILSARVANGRPFTCLVANDRELLRLNREFLNRDYPADVLSFPASDGEAELGELAISIERASAQSTEHRHTLLDEIRILMLHGVLHLTGLDHERDRGEMARAEQKWRGVFGLPVTLIARAASRVTTQSRTARRAGVRSSGAQRPRMRAPGQGKKPAALCGARQAHSRFVALCAIPGGQRPSCARSLRARS